MQPEAIHLGVLGEFRRGLTQRHPLVIAIGFLGAVFALMTLEWVFITGAYTVIPESHLLLSPENDRMHVSYRVASLRRRAPNRPAIYLLGGSAMRECIQSEEALARAIRDHSGIEVEIHNLAIGDSNLANCLAIVENLPAGDATIVVGLNPYRFARKPEENELQLRGKPLLLKSWRLWRRTRNTSSRHLASVSILPGILTYCHDYYHQHLMCLRERKLPTSDYLQHGIGYRLEDMLPVDVKRKYVRRWFLEYSDAFERHTDYNVDLLRELIELAKSREFSVVLLEEPRNLSIVEDAFDQVDEAYRTPCRQLAKTHRLVYLDFIEKSELQNDDFFDISHLLESGQKKYQACLAEKLAFLNGRSLKIADNR